MPYVTNPDTYFVHRYNIRWYQSGGRSRHQAWRKRQSNRLVRRTALAVIAEEMAA